MRNSTLNAKAPRLLTRLVFACALFVLLFAKSPQANAQYCSPYNYYPYYGYIQRFVFNGIDNPNYTYNYYGGYSDYSGSYISNACFPGNTYTATVYGYSLWGSNYSGCKIWVDWNNNYSFADAGELVYNSGYSTINYNFSVNITIPTTATTGNHRMRITFAGYYYYINYADYCSGYYYQETEDYTLKVSPPPNDAGITGFTAPPKGGYRFTAPQNVTATLKNFSNKWQLKSVTINWSVNGVTQTPYNWSGTLDTLASTNVTISNAFNFQPAAPWDSATVRIWTTNPQGTDANANTLPDGNSANDSYSGKTICIMQDVAFLNCDKTIPLVPGVNKVTGTFQNMAPKPLSSGQVNWWVNYVPKTAYQWTGGPVNYNSTVDISPGSYDFGSANIPFKITMQFFNPNGYPDEYTANDSGSVDVYKALPGGTYTIGLNNSDFTSMQAFADFVNYWGLAGPVTILFRPGTYQCGQTLAPRGGGKFPMTFGSVTGSNYDVTLYNSATTSAGNFVLGFDGNNDITIKNLTINATGSSFATCLMFKNGNSRIAIDNCIFNGKANAPQTHDYDLIYADQDLITSWKITNCIFNYGSDAMHLTAPTGLYSSNVEIANCNFSNFTWKGLDLANIHGANIHDNSFYGSSFNYGIYAINCSNITNNRINGVTGANMGAAFTVDEAGITVIHNDPAADNAVITGNTVAGTNCNGIYVNASAGLTLNQNIINVNSLASIDRAGLNVFASGSGSSYAQVMNNTILGSNLNGIYLNGTTAKVYYNKVNINGGNQVAMFADAGTSGYIANNMFSAINSTAGEIQGTTNLGIYYNTFYSNTAQPSFIKTNLGTGNDLQRNIFYNNGSGYAVAYQPPVAGSFTANYNDLYTKGANLGLFNTTVCSNLAAWQAATGQAANSVNEPVVFMSETDLRLLQLDPVLYFTTPLGIPEIDAADYTGKARTILYYMGANTIIPAITVKQQPMEIVNCYGSTGQMFIVIASIDYGGSLTYQWYKDGQLMPGQTNAILNFAPLTHEMPGVYYCIIKGNGGASDVQTNSVLLYTLRKTEITRQPANNMLDLGETAKFDLDVHVYDDVPSAYQPTIQWYRDTIPLVDNDRISGSKSSILTIRDIKPTDYANNYKVVITGLCGTATSQAISIMTKPQITINTEPDTLGVCEGTSATFKTDASVNQSGITMNYQWRFNGVPIDDDGHITGAKTSVLNITNVKATDNGNYDCLITLENGLDVKSTRLVPLTVKLLPTIITQPVAMIAVKKDAELKLDVVAQGHQPLSYAWFKNGAPLSDSAATLDRTAAAVTDAGTYICKVWNECGEVWTKESQVTVLTSIMMGATDDAQAGGFSLLQNSPNPVNCNTVIGIVAPFESNVKLTISDLFGREIKSMSLNLNAGYNAVDFNAAELNSGIYNYNISVNGVQATRRMIVVK